MHTPHGAGDGEQADPDAGKGGRSGRKPCILAVEDSEDAQHLLRYILARAYEVDIVSTFEEALDRSEALVYNMVMVDINLGGKRSGVDVLHALRRLEAYRGVPIIACTAYALPGDKERLLAEGFNGYISKPFRRSELITMIEEQMRR